LTHGGRLVVASIERRTRDGQVRWCVRYRTPSGQQRNKTFTRKIDAERYLTGIEHSKIVGSYVDPSRSKITMGEWADEWLSAQQHLKASTFAKYQGTVAKWIKPQWGSAQLSRITHADVQRWVGGLTLGPGSKRQTFRVLSLILDLAVRDGRIAVNPAAGVRLPRVVKPEKRFLTPEQVHQLADAAAAYPIPDFGLTSRALVYVLAFGGLRWGEAAALRVKRIDLLRRRITVAENVTEVRCDLIWGTPKNHQTRSVPIPRFLADLLQEQVAGKAQTDLVFTTWHGQPLRNPNWRRDVFDRAAADAGLEGLTPHELRHTAASLAVSAGANIKAVQRMLGHASAAMTLDTYVGLFDDDLDGVAVRMDSLHGVSPMRHEAPVIDLPNRAN
jgi:integrase